MNTFELLYGWFGLNVAVSHWLVATMPQRFAPVMHAVSWLSEPAGAPLWAALFLGVFRAKRGTVQAVVWRDVAWTFLLGAALALSVAWAAKIGLGFSRPTGAYPQSSGFSTPSGHATLAALLVTTAWRLSSRWTARYGLLAGLALVGWARVALQAHYFADVLWGYIIGAVAATLAARIVEYTRRDVVVGRAFATALVVLCADLITKAMVVVTAPLGFRHELLPFLALGYWLNPGAAFSLLHDAGGWQRLLFIAIAIVATVVLTFLILRSSESKIERYGFGFILGGAVANVFDRFIRGAVVDWIDVFWGRYHWPAFNIADMGITAGALLVITAAWRARRSPESGPPAP